MATQAYFSGDWYQCIVATSAGESPATNPEKWAKMEIPAIAEDYLVEKAVALLLQADGMQDKRMQAEGLAKMALDDTIDYHAVAGDFERSTVAS